MSHKRVGTGQACLLGIQKLYELNERGPALNVFWIPEPGLGAGRCGVLPCRHRLEYSEGAYKNGPEGAQSRKAWLSSVRRLDLRHNRSNRARTRWVTERIASRTKKPGNRPKSNRTKTQDRVTEATDMFYDHSKKPEEEKNRTGDVFSVCIQPLWATQRASTVKGMKATCALLKGPYKVACNATVQAINAAGRTACDLCKKP